MTRKVRLDFELERIARLGDDPVLRGSLLMAKAPLASSPGGLHFTSSPDRLNPVLGTASHGRPKYSDREDSGVSRGNA